MTTTPSRPTKDSSEGIKKIMFLLQFKRTPAEYLQTDCITAHNYADNEANNLFSTIQPVFNIPESLRFGALDTLVPTLQIKMHFNLQVVAFNPTSPLLPKRKPQPLSHDCFQPY